MTSLLILAHHIHSLRRTILTMVLAAPVLAGCSSFHTSQTDFDAYTIDAASSGEKYKDFEYKSFSVCPQGFRRIDATASNDGEGSFTQWKIRCTTMVIHAGE
jgi:hypothetical protein